MLSSMLSRGASAGALTLALVSASAFAQESLPTIDVGAESANGRQPAAGSPGGASDPTAYHKPNSTTATKTDTPIKLIPTSVQIVPHQVLVDQQAVVIDDAIKNVSGVFSSPYVGLQGGWNIRGFLDYAYYLDGVRVNPFAALAPRETVDVQQIEILKGPASILYGRIQPGGLVEITTKQPQAEPHYELQQLFGSYDRYRTTLSMTGPLDAEKNLLYRLDASYESANSFREGLHGNHVFLAPKLKWSPTQDTSATFYLQYYSGRDPIDGGIPGLYGKLVPKSFNVVAPVPISRNFGSRDAALLTRYDLRLGYRFEHSFDADWKLMHRFDLNTRDVPEKWVDVYNPNPAACSLAGCRVDRDALAITPNTEQNYFTSLDVNGHFDTFGLSHTLLIGADGYHTKNDATLTFNWSNVPPTDLFNPANPGDLLPYTAIVDSSFRQVIRESWYGVYLQDQIALPYDFHLLAGFRYDSAHNSTDRTNRVPVFSTRYTVIDADAVKPRVGLLWQPLPQLSLYGNYVEGFGGSSGVNADNRALPPEEARQWEGGVKLDLFDSRLSATASWFDILKTNVRTPSPNPALNAAGFKVSTGAVRNSGVELDVQGQATDEIKLIGSYTHIDSQIVSDNSGVQGNRWWGVPRDAGSLWAVYEPQFALLRGAAFGAGFVSRGRVEVDRANSFSIPGYTVVDLMARYGFDHLGRKVTFQLNVGNLLDRTYYISSGSTSGFIPGAPRTFKGSVKIEF